MRNAPNPFLKSTLTVALSCALTALAACGGDDDPAPIADNVTIGAASDAVNSTDGDNNTGGDNTGGNTGATDDGTNTGDTGNTGGDTGTGGTDGNGDNGTGDTGNTGGDTTNSDPEEGDVMQPVAGADSTTVEYNCSQMINGQTQTVSHTLGFDPANLTFTLDGNALGLGDFVWNNDKSAWVAGTNIAAGSESQFQVAYVDADGVPIYFFTRLTSGEATIEELLCPSGE